MLGGGLVPGAVVLVAGEPGIGKSTLLLDVAGRAARGGEPGHERRVLYVSGEESAAQVRSRAERIEAMARTLFLASETDLATVLGQIDQVQPELVIVDSVQTISSAEVEGAAGNVSQVREVAASIIAMAKSRGIAAMLVGHVTKDGSIAGPRVLEHLVDVVVQFEGDRHSRLRLVRAVKNRYGPTDEVGCFDLSDVGITGLADPSGLFLSNRTAAVPGTCVTVTLEGRRPLVTEVQALVDQTEMPNPRRATSGLDSARVGMILAVLGARAKAPIGRKDVFVSTVGGVRITEPAADLALTLALASALTDQAAAHRHRRVRRGRAGRRAAPRDRCAPPAGRGVAAGLHHRDRAARASSAAGRCPTGCASSRSPPCSRPSPWQPPGPRPLTLTISKMVREPRQRSRPDRSGSRAPRGSRTGSRSMARRSRPARDRPAVTGPDGIPAPLDSRPRRGNLT